MALLSATLTLFLVMDPLGNIPLFLAVLRVVPAERRRRVLLREIGVAYLVLLGIMLAGRYLMSLLQLEPATIGIAGGIILFLIAIRMVFPSGHGAMGETMDGEPFIVPLAVPLLAGPSAMAVVLLLQQSPAIGAGPLFAAVTGAWLASGAILMASTFFYRLLGERGLVAMERLMGMILVMVAVQMTTDGIRTYTG